MLGTWLGETLNAMWAKTTSLPGDDSGNSGSPRGDGSVGVTETHQRPRTTRTEASLFLYVTLFEEEPVATSEQSKDD